MGMKVFASGINYDTLTLGSGDVSQKFKALYIGVTGDVAIFKKDITGTSVVFKNVAVGFFPMEGAGIDDSLTTASSINWIDW